MSLSLLCSLDLRKSRGSAKRKSSNRRHGGRDSSSERNQGGGKMSSFTFPVNVFTTFHEKIRKSFEEERGKVRIRGKGEAILTKKKSHKGTGKMDNSNYHY